MRSIAIVLGLAWIGAFTACEARVSLGGRCVVEADCAGVLACVGGRCREECTTPADCPVGLRCVAGASGLRACSLPPEEVCSDTDPCDEALFAECRAGRCVTGCTDPGDCVAGSCDMTGSTGVCIEPISVGDADAGLADADLVDAGVIDADLTDSGLGCLPETEDSTRTISSAVLGVDGTVDRSEPAWLEALGSAAIAIDDAASASFAIGARTTGSAGPEVLAAVRGAGGFVTLRRGRPLEDNLHTTIDDAGTTAYASTGAFSDVAVRSSPTAIDFVGLFPAPPTGGDAFASVLREGGSPYGMSPMRNPPGPFPGGVAYLDGPTGPLIALRYSPPGEPGGRLGVIGPGLGGADETHVALPGVWGERPVQLASAPSVLVVHEPASRASRVVWVPRLMGGAPVLDDDPLELESDGAPAIAATTAPARFRVLSLAASCSQLPLFTLACDPAGASNCALEPTGSALRAPGPVRVQASAFGRAAAVLVDDRTGARLIVLDEDGVIVDLVGPLILAPELTGPRGETLTLTRSSLASTATATAALVAIGGLYTNATGTEARVRVLALGVTAL